MVQDQFAASKDPRDTAVSGLDEWGVVTVLAGAGELRLFSRDGRLPGWPSSAAPGIRSVAGLLSRAPGEFVGRRGEQRTLPPVLVDPHTEPGMVLHGIGGIGKTTLAAEVVLAAAGVWSPAWRAGHGVSARSPWTACWTAVAATARRQICCAGRRFTRETGVTAVQAGPSGWICRGSGTGSVCSARYSWPGDRPRSCWWVDNFEDNLFVRDPAGSDGLFDR